MTRTIGLISPVPLSRFFPVGFSANSAESPRFQESSFNALNETPFAEWLIRAEFIERSSNSNHKSTYLESDEQRFESSGVTMRSAARSRSYPAGHSLTSGVRSGRKLASASTCKPEATMKSELASTAAPSSRRSRSWCNCCSRSRAVYQSATRPSRVR